MTNPVTPPARIWLLDYGSDECTWCTDPDPSGEDHEPIAYVLATAMDDVTEDRDRWKQSEQTCLRLYGKLVVQAEALAKALAIFLGEDERFQPMVGGNPNAIDAMIDEARAILAAYRSTKP